MPDKMPPPQKKGPESTPEEQKSVPKPVKEIGGPRGAEPTRYGDWEKNGRVSDF